VKYEPEKGMLERHREQLRLRAERPQRAIPLLRKQADELRSYQELKRKRNSKKGVGV
jgi:hypothetical protein